MRIARNGNDDALVALVLSYQARIAVDQGRVSEGMGLLDEALLMAMEEGFEPAIAGNIYCDMMSTCYELGDLQRMDQWVEQTKVWCEAAPSCSLVPRYLSRPSGAVARYPRRVGSGRG